MGVQAGSTASDGFASAHRALTSDRTIQFDLTAVPPRPQTPGWLVRFGDWLLEILAPVGRLFAWIDRHLPDALYARIFLWTVIAVLAGALLWLVIQRLRDGMWRFGRRGVAVSRDPADDPWLPDAAPARMWLEEADALAGEGRFGDAVHHLLTRSIEDIAAHRPALVQPAVTSRELTRASALPATVRLAFSNIAIIVERHLFGGRQVSKTDWAAARREYSDFALDGAWRE